MGNSAILNKIVVHSTPESVNMDNTWFEVTHPDHFWMKSRMRYLTKMLKSQHASGAFLDIGCGTGQTIKATEEAIDCIVDGLDLDISLLESAPKIQGTLMVANIMDDDLNIGKAYDVILLLDVIEHIENDKSFLQKTMRLLKPGGIIIINVPAFQSLYSRYDLVLGHQRRHTSRSLSQCATAVGLEILDVRYWGVLLIPLLVIRKVILLFTPEESVTKTGFKEPSKRIAKFLDFVCRLEFGLFQYQPLGSSVMGAFKKPIR